MPGGQESLNKRARSSDSSDGSDTGDKPKKKRQEVDRSNILQYRGDFKTPRDAREGGSFALKESRDMLADIEKRFRAKQSILDDKDALKGAKSLIESKLEELDKSGTYEHPGALFNAAYSQAYLEEYKKEEHSEKAEILKKLRDIQNIHLEVSRERNVEGKETESKEHVRDDRPLDVDSEKIARSLADPKHAWDVSNMPALESHLTRRISDFNKLVASDASDETGSGSKKNEIQVLKSEIDKGVSILNQLKIKQIKTIIRETFAKKRDEFRSVTEAEKLGRLKADGAKIAELANELTGPLNIFHAPKLEAYVIMRERDRNELQKRVEHQQTLGMRDTHSESSHEQELKALTNEIETVKNLLNPLKETQLSAIKASLMNTRDNKNNEFVSATEAEKLGRLNADGEEITAFHEELTRPLDVAHVPELESYISMSKRDRDDLQEQSKTSKKGSQEKNEDAEKLQALTNEIENLENILKPLKEKQISSFEAINHRLLEKKTNDLRACELQVQSAARTRKLATLEADIARISRFTTDLKRPLDESDLTHLEAYINICKRDKEDVQKLINLLEKRNNRIEERILSSKETELKALTSEIGTLEGVHRSLKVQERERKQQTQENIYRLVGSDFFKQKVADEKFINEIANQLFAEIEGRQTDQKYSDQYKDLLDTLTKKLAPGIDNKQKWDDFRQMMKQYANILDRKREDLSEENDGLAGTSVRTREFNDIVISINELQTRMRAEGLMKGHKDYREDLLLMGTTLHDIKEKVAKQGGAFTNIEEENIHALMEGTKEKLFGMKPGFLRALEHLSTAKKAENDQFMAPDASALHMRAGSSAQADEAFEKANIASEVNKHIIERTDWLRQANKMSRDTVTKLVQDGEKTQLAWQRLKEERETIPALKALKDGELNKPINEDTINVIDDHLERWINKINDEDFRYKILNAQMIEIDWRDDHLGQEITCLKAQVAIANDFLRAPAVQQFLGSLANKQGKQFSKDWKERVSKINGRVEEQEKVHVEMKEELSEHVVDLDKIRNDIEEQRADYNALVSKFSAVLPDN